MSASQLKDIVARIGERMGGEALGGKLKLDLGDFGSLLIDGTHAPNSVSDGARQDADCTIHASVETVEQMINGVIDGTTAFMQGALRIDGDMSLAMRLDTALQGARS